MSELHKRTEQVLLRIASRGVVGKPATEIGRTSIIEPFDHACIEWCEVGINVRVTDVGRRMLAASGLVVPS